MDIIQFAWAKFTIITTSLSGSSAGDIFQQFGAAGTGKLYRPLQGFFLPDHMTLVIIRKNRRQVALKVQKSASHYTEAAMDEIEFLRKVHSFCTSIYAEVMILVGIFLNWQFFLQASETQGSGSDHVVRLLDHFKHIGPHGTHVCMVFEPMGANLLSLIKHYDYHGVPIDLVRHMARQVPLWC